MTPNPAELVKLTERDERFLQKLEDPAYAKQAAIAWRRHALRLAAQQDAGAASVREAAERVVWFDWTGNDSDAVEAVDQLRRALEQAAGGSD